MLSLILVECCLHEYTRRDTATLCLALYFFYIPSPYFITTYWTNSFAGAVSSTSLHSIVGHTVRIATLRLSRSDRTGLLTHVAHQTVAPQFLSLHVDEVVRLVTRSVLYDDMAG